MSRVKCEKVELIESTSVTSEDLRSTLNALCDQIEDGRITNMDMTIITMGVDMRDISVSNIVSSAQLHPSKVLPNRISATSVQAVGVDQDQLFSAYNLLCSTVQPSMFNSLDDDGNKNAIMRMGSSDYEVVMTQIEIANTDEDEPAEHEEEVEDDF